MLICTGCFIKKMLPAISRLAGVGVTFAQNSPPSFVASLAVGSRNQI